MGEEVLTRRERFDNAISLAMLGLRRWDKMLNDLEKIADDYAGQPQAVQSVVTGSKRKSGKKK